MGKVLIIAFDGLDYELIQKYDLEKIKQKEFGRIDNRTGITTLVTSELFASFLTGETWEEHGIIGLDHYESNLLNKIENLNRYKFFRNFTGLRNSIYSKIPFVNSDKRHVTREDYDQETFLDRVENSVDIGVRAYSKGYTTRLMDVMDSHGLKEAEKEMRRFERMKERELFDALRGDEHLIMAHFHKVDYIHHWFWEIGEMEKVEETYHEIDEFAGKIIEKARENDFETIIFMSDHGLPDVEGGGHNQNAFYSCNYEIFGDETPHITDFHDRILELVEDEDLRPRSEEVEGLEV